MEETSFYSMIYFITNTLKTINASDINCSATVEDCLKYFKDKEFISVDTETTGFDPHRDKVLLLQLGDKHNQFVFDNTIDFKVFKELLEEKLLLGQNIKFDLRFLYKLGIFPTKVYDTFLAEKKLYQGIPNHLKNLQALNDRYVGSGEVDKSLRGLVHRGLTDVVIRYAANDVKPLEIIKEKQTKRAKEFDLEKAIQLENEFVLALAYIEYSGIYLDVGKWNKKVEKRSAELKEAEAKLNEYVLNNPELFKYVDAQLNLFSTERTVSVNWASPDQVKTLFKDLGINIKVTEKGVEKESIEAGVLLPQIDSFDILPLYLHYKKLAKDISTYGFGVSKQVISETGRLHTSFQQIVDTGRMSSGGKNKATGEEYINLQNIPSDGETRGCFTNQSENTVLINCDYSGMEQVVLANISQDPDLIDFYHSGKSDMHSFIASKIYNIKYDAYIEAIRKKDAKLLLSKDDKDRLAERKIAKSAGFALNYGGTGFTIALNLSISIAEGTRVEESYFGAFPKLKEFYDKQEAYALKHGYILVDQLTGSKSFIAEYTKFRSLYDQYTFDNRDFWDTYRQEKRSNSPYYQSIKEEVRYYFRWKSQIRRNALNYPVQGSSATITKIAGIKFFNWIKENNLIHKVLISNVIHDEYLVECPKDMAELVAGKLQECMQDAAIEYCPIIPLKADPNITTEWEH